MPRADEEVYYDAQGRRQTRKILKEGDVAAAEATEAATSTKGMLQEIKRREAEKEKAPKAESPLAAAARKAKEARDRKLPDGPLSPPAGVTGASLGNAGLKALREKRKGKGKGDAGEGGY